MFNRLSEILEFIGGNDENIVRRFLAKSLADSNISYFLENLFGFQINVLAEGIFSESKELWKPLYLANQLKNAGIISYINSSLRVSEYADEPLIFHYSAPIKLSSSRKDIVAGGTSSISPIYALWRCLGESVERYSSFNFKEGNCRVASIKELGSNALDPRKVTGFSENQLKNLRSNIISDNSIFRWTKGYSLTRKESFWIPSQLLYGNYKWLQGESQIRSYVTTGAAAYYGSKEQALINGILEVIERDAFMISWLNRLNLPRIDINTIDYKPVQDLLSKIKRYNFEIHLLDMSTDIPIPSILGILIDPYGYGPIVVGAKTHFSKEDAVLSVVEDVIKTRYFIRRIYENHKKEIEENNIPVIPVTMEDRAIFWMKKERLSDLDFYFKGKVISFDDIKSREDLYYNLEPKETLDKLVKLLAEHKLEVFYADLTPENIENTPWRAVSVVIPQAAYLWLNELFPSYGCRRIYEVPVLKGYRNNPSTESDINKTPHPFL
jgi:ribosomal protein S12 methylthiotransferase accessory factor